MGKENCLDGEGQGEKGRCCRVFNVRYSLSLLCFASHEETMFSPDLLKCSLNPNSQVTGNAYAIHVPCTLDFSLYICWLSLMWHSQCAQPRFNQILVPAFFVEVNAYRLFHINVCRHVLAGCLDIPCGVPQDSLLFLLLQIGLGHDCLQARGGNGCANLWWRGSKMVGLFRRHVFPSLCLRWLNNLLLFGLT